MSLARGGAETRRPSAVDWWDGAGWTRETKLNLLERERELTEVDALLRRPGTGRGGLIVIRAHAGLGKSALLDAAVQSARAMPSLRVASFVCDQLECHLAWAAAGGLLGEALGNLTTAAGWRVLSGAAAPAADAGRRGVGRGAGLPAGALSLGAGLPRRRDR